MAHRANIYGFKKSDIFLASIMAGIGLIVGAKIVFMISVIPDYINHWDIVTSDIPYAIFYALSGFVFYGGLIGVILMLLLYCRHLELDFGSFMNVVAPVIPFIHGLGRVGCFFGGCCYGIEYHGPLSVQFPDNPFVEDLNLVPRFPIQLLEAAINIVIFIILYQISKKPRKPGFMLGLYLITYAIIRFSLEFLRGDVERGFFLNVSTSQWISLILIPIGIYLIVRKRKSNA